MTRLVCGGALAVLTLLLAGCADSATIKEPSAVDTAIPSPVAPYLDNWSAVHADHRNTNYAPVAGAADIELAWKRKLEGSVRLGPLPWTINLGPTVDADQVYVTSTVSGCHLQAFDAATGDTRWCASNVDMFAVASAPLLDRDGRLYVADGTAMRAFSRDGAQLWETPINGVPLSAQFTAQGHVVLITHIGNVLVLDRLTGRPVLPVVELIPGAIWDSTTGMQACARGTQECPSANTPAVDLETGRIFFTFWQPGTSQASLRAVKYTEDPEPAITALWTNDGLPGGSGSSPVLSEDGSRVYVTDNEGGLHALDTATGESIWAFEIGYAAGGSPSLAPDGTIIPAGGRTSPLLAIRDEGARGALAWQRERTLNRGGTTQTGGGRVYATLDAGELKCEIAVFDRTTGAELDRELLPDTCVFSVGTSVGADGTVYVATIVGGLYAFRPYAD